MRNNGKSLTKRVGRPPKSKTPEELEERIGKYFNERDEKKKPYTISWLALALGYADRSGLYRLRAHKAFGTIIKRAYLHIETQLNERLLQPGQPTAGIIFCLKNHFGWKDTQEQQLLGKDGQPILMAMFPPMPQSIEEWQEMADRYLPKPEPTAIEGEVSQIE